MTRRLATTAFLLLGACGGPTDVTPAVRVYPTELVLPVARVTDTETPWYTVGVLNVTWFGFDVQDVALTGEGAPFLELDLDEGAQVIPLDAGTSLRLGVRVAAATAGTIGEWRTTAEPLTATLGFSTVGTGSVDPTTGEPDPAQVVVTPYSVNVRFKLSCDVDGDGSDALACLGGFDCDDAIAAVEPGAREVCDEIDNDCNGTIDDACVEP